MEPAATVVRIQGQEYTIRSEADPEYVRRIASYVDDRMQEVARSSQQVSSLRVAILAALNIADELFRIRDGGGTEAQALEDRALELAATQGLDPGPLPVVDDLKAWLSS